MRIAIISLFSIIITLNNTIQIEGGFGKFFSCLKVKSKLSSCCLSKKLEKSGETDSEEPESTQRVISVEEFKKIVGSPLYQSTPLAERNIPPSVTCNASASVNRNVSPSAKRNVSSSVRRNILPPVNRNILPSTRRSASDSKNISNYLYGRNFPAANFPSYVDIIDKTRPNTLKPPTYTYNVGHTVEVPPWIKMPNE